MIEESERLLFGQAALNAILTSQKDDDGFG
jgi:hypothetical protein